ncbi:MAG: type I-G CRISPR-associated protein Csb2, partial [Candidatus Thorarchaeota archaeon]
MLSIRFRFPAGRYHATPWNRQVNEGEVEWPPFPWRIARSLISIYYLKMKHEVDEHIIKGLIDKLSALPEYHLPKASIGHTRQYMPQYEVGKTSLIFDTFASISKYDYLFVVWSDVELEESEKRLLEELLSRMSYLGRAESWVEAEIYPCNEKINCVPLSLYKGTDEIEPVDVLVPMKSLEFEEWKKVFFNSSSSRTRKHLKEIPSMWDALCIDTAKLKEKGWSQPPGSRWVQYVRPSNCFKISPAVKYKEEGKKKPTIARFAIASTVPPRLTEAVSFADRIHDYLVKISDQSSVFTGCDENKKPLTGHKHAFVISESNIALGKGKRGEITHVSIYAPIGFGKRERKALDELTGVWGRKGHDIQLVLIGVGHPKDFGGIGQEESGKTSIFAESRVWESRTPFIPTLHSKFSRSGEPKMIETSVKIEGMPQGAVQVGSPEYDLLRILGEMGFPEPEEIGKTDGTDLAGRKTRWLEFKRSRYGGNGKKSTEIGYGFRIVFPQPVRGPIAVGYG